MKNLESVTLYGTVAGRMWMPSCHAWKEFQVKLVPGGAHFAREWHGLRDALMEIANDGDFQSCGLVDAALIATYNTGPNRTTQIRGEINLDAKALADLKATPEAVDAYFNNSFDED